MSSEELAVFTQPIEELPYVNVHRLLVEIGVAVPEIYFDASNDNLLLLEDVGDVALRDAVAGKSEHQVEALFTAAIDQLLLIQLAGTKARRNDCVAFRQAFDERLFLWEFEHFLQYGLSVGQGETLTGDELALLRRHFTEIARFLDRQPRYLNHRDFHAWNLFIQEGRIRVLDFQDALMGPAPYDLATLLGDRDTPTVIGPECERRLVDYYRRGWEERGGVPWKEQELERTYMVCGLQKAFKVVGRFQYLNQVKKKPGYLVYIPTTLRRIDHLLDKWPGANEMRSVLGKCFPELRR